MDKTYNELMDIVNRTKKYDSKEPRKVVKKVSTEPKIHETNVTDTDEVPNFFAGKEAINKLLNKPKTAKKKSTKETGATKGKKTTAKKITKKTTTKKDSVKKTTAKKTTKKEDEAEISKEIKPKKSAKLDPNDPKSKYFYEALQSTLYAGDTDISEYIEKEEDGIDVQNTLSKLKAKREAQRINSEITKEQQAYEQLFTGSLGGWQKVESAEVEERENIKSKLEVVHDPESAGTPEGDAGYAHYWNNIEQDRKQAEEVYPSNEDLDRKIADYYKRKQEKIAEEKRREEEGEIIVKNYKEGPTDYYDVFSGEMYRREELVGVSEPSFIEEDVVEEQAPVILEEKEPENRTEFQKIYNDLNSFDEDINVDSSSSIPSVVDIDYSNNVEEQKDEIEEFKEKIEDIEIIKDELQQEDKNDDVVHSEDDFKKDKEYSIKRNDDYADFDDDELDRINPYAEDKRSEPLEETDDFDDEEDKFDANLNSSIEDDEDSSIEKQDDIEELTEESESVEIDLEEDHEEKDQDMEIYFANTDDKPDSDSEEESLEEVKDDEVDQKDDELVDEVSEDIIEEVESESEEVYVDRQDLVDPDDIDDDTESLDSYLISSKVDEDNLMVIDNLPESHAELVTGNTKDLVNEEIEEKLSKEDFLSSINKLQENLLSEIKGIKKETEEIAPKEAEENKQEEIQEESLEETNLEEITNTIDDEDIEDHLEMPDTDIEKMMKNKEFRDKFNSNIALNEEDLEFYEKKTAPREVKDDYFYLSDKDKELKDEYLSVYDDNADVSASNIKEMGDINLNASIVNAVPSSQQLKEEQDTKLKEEMQIIYTILGKQEKPVEEKLEPMKVLYVAGECQPFIATGGLGDVAGSLPKAIAKADNVDIRVVLPLYGAIKETYRDKFEYLGNFTVHLAWRQEYCGLFRYHADGVTYYFIDNERYFKREKMYGYYDDGERFAYFCKAIVESLPMINFFPDIIHCNDWQSALVSTYIKTGNWSDFRYYKIKNVYTIHNVEYQGVYGMENLKDLFGIDPRFTHDVEYNRDINLTKAAIQYSDKFTTVSHSYCDNLKQPYCSRGLHHIIIRNEYKLCGILNGIDPDFYNPETDTTLYKNYSVASIDDKVMNKKIWQDELGLPVDANTPMFAIVSRLVSHKGIDLITKVIEDVLQKDIQLVVVGTGDDKYVNYFKYLEEKYPTKVRAMVDKYSNELARKAYGASDIFLMPSKIEPCGLSQMIASRYGSVPIVRETGGLRDSIKDFGCEGGGNGYTFTNYNPNDLLYQMNRAIKDYDNKTEWKKKMEICMTTDFGWDKSAKEYIAMYKSLL